MTSMMIASRASRNGTSMKFASAATLGLLVLSLHLGSCGESRAGIVYQTGFENPPFVAGPLASQDGWTVFGGGITSASVMIEVGVAKSGSQAMEINSAFASGQTGGYRVDASSVGDTIVEMQADVLLTSSSVETAWQFLGVPTGGGAIGGFNVLTNGTLQLITSGFPTTASVVTRDVWNHYEVDYNFTTQTFNVLINQHLVAANVAFYSSASVFGQGNFDTFNATGGNDLGYMDNYSVIGVSGVVVPEPASLTLLGMGTLVLMGATRARRRRGGSSSGGRAPRKLEQR